MSAVQSIPFPRPVNPLERLKLAAGKSKSGALIYDGEYAQANAERYLQLARQEKDLAAELAVVRDAVLDAVTPWHLEQVQRKNKHTPTVIVETPAGELRVMYQAKYNKIMGNREEDIRQAVNGDYDRLFRKVRALKVKPAVTEDEGAFDSLVAILREHLGCEMFDHVFETEETIQPTKAYTETQHALPAETRAALGLAGVRQIVSLSAKGGAE